MTVNHQKQLTVQHFLNNPQRTTVTGNMFLESSTTGQISHDVDSIPLSHFLKKSLILQNSVKFIMKKLGGAFFETPEFNAWCNNFTHYIGMKSLSLVYTLQMK